MIRRLLAARFAALPLILGLSLLITLPLPAIASLDAAQSDWDQGKPQSAVVRLKDLLQQDPENAGARLLLAQIYLDTGELAAAEQELMRARGAGASDAATRAGLVRALLGQGQASRALEWTEPPADATAAERAELSALRGSVLLTQNQEIEAARAFAEAIETDPDGLRPLLGIATLDLRRGEIEAARAGIRQAIRQHPDAADAWQALGVLEKLDENPKAAVEAFTEALSRARAKWPIHYQRAEAYLDLQELDAAAADIEAVRNERSRLPGLDYLDGRIALLQGDPAAAEHLEAYLRVAPSDPRAIYFAALALNRSGRHAQAEEYLLRLTAAVPDNPTALTLLARTRLAQGDATGAEEAVRPVAESADANPMAMETLRQALEQQGRTDEAQRVVSQAAERFPALTSAQLAYARQLQQTGDVGGAIDLLRRVIETEPENERARMLLIRSHLAAGDIDAATAAVDAFLAQSPESPLAYAAQGALMTQQRDFDAARNAFGKALELDPAFGAAALALAALELGTNRQEQARATLDKLLEADPDNVDITLARAAMAQREEGVEAFRGELREALERNPDALPLRLALARSLLGADSGPAARTLLNEAPPAQRTGNAFLLLRAQAELAAGDSPATAATLTSLIERNPTNPRFRYMLASFYAEQGDPRAAETNLEEGLRIDNDAVLEHQRLANILGAQPTAEARKQMLERLSARAPEHPTIRAAQARFLTAQGDFAEADSILTELAAAYPDNAAYVVWLADARKRNDGAAAAEQLMSDWLREHPENVAVRLALAQHGIDTGDHDLAIAQYRQVIQQNANSPVALNNLAMLLAEKNPDEAIEYADRALALAPDNAAFIDTKGTVLMAQGDYAAAVELLAKAQANSVDPSIAFRYAKALVETGDSSTARRVLLNLQTQSFPERSEAEALLRELSGRD